MIDFNKVPDRFKTAKPALAEGSFLTPIGRMVYPDIIEPAQYKGKPGKYAVTMMFPPEVDVSLITKAIRERLETRFGKAKVDAPESTIKRPTKSWATCKGAGAAEGWTIIKFSSGTKPQVLDACHPSGVKTSVTEKNPETVYSGRWAILSTAFYDYDNEGKGVGAGINNILLLNHDEAISNRLGAEDEFADVEAVASSADDMFG